MSSKPATAAAPAAFPGVSEGVARRLALLGLRRPCDLLLHLPLRYEDETRLRPIAQAQRTPGSVVVEGVVSRAEVRPRPRRMLTCTIEDDSGAIQLRFVNVHPAQQRSLVPGARVRASGEIRPGLLGAEMIHPRWRLVAPGTPLPDRLTPVYPTTAGLAQAVLQRLATRALEGCDLSDTLPPALLARWGLQAFEPSLRLLHAPPPGAPLQALADRSHPAWRRIAFDELLAQQLAMRAHRRARSARRAVALPAGRGALAAQVLAAAGFMLTEAQARVSAQIARDLERTEPMQRLLQGDVGSGKTIVAALAAAQAVEAGYQVAVMAPTELLAEQTHRKFAGWFAEAGVEVAWLAGSLPRRQREAATARIASGGAAIAVGTHALFQQGVAFARLALAIVDEQHRFGVNQRLALREKVTAAGVGQEAHLLMMSATPIPRTLAMACYADLDVSVIDALPPGRTPVATRLVSAARREEVIVRVRDACRQGAQAYWVCPLIEESEALQLQTAVDTHAALVAELPGLAVGLVHGRQKPAEKAAAMGAFQRGETQLLVATTVIEVGVDVPNASLMVIEHAERMGLAQLHQLRGRVGRGAAQSSCILMYQPPLGPIARERLRVVYESRDGFEIAQRDLELRGPGELTGARQSGLPLLRFADPVRDAPLLEAAASAADTLLDRVPVAVERHLARWLPDAPAWLRG
jgi:ATP-dependent DNA helicase RecG